MTLLLVIVPLVCLALVALVETTLAWWDAADI